MFCLVDLMISPFLYPCFCLNALNSKNIYYILFVSLFIDFIITSYYGYITIIFLILYVIDLKLKNYYLKNMINFTIFYLILYPFKWPIFIFSLVLYLLFISLLKNSYY